MKQFTIDAHHAILYGLLALVSLAGLGVVHAWRMDLEKAKGKTAVDQATIREAEQDRIERAKQFEAQLELLRSLKLKPNAPAPLIITRLQGLEPSMNVLPDQLVAPKPDAPKVNLVLDPAQQIDLVNRLIDCKQCEVDRDRSQSDLAAANTKLQAMTEDRDTWKQTAQGGSLRTRLKRRAWHFVEDAIAIELFRAIGGHP